MLRDLAMAFMGQAVWADALLLDAGFQPKTPLTHHIRDMLILGAKAFRKAGATDKQGILMAACVLPHNASAVARLVGEVGLSEVEAQQALRRVEGVAYPAAILEGLPVQRQAEMNEAAGQ